MEYYTERISPKNFPSFIEIFSQTYGDQNSDKANFLNKFNTKYTELDFIGYIAFHKADHSPAAFYGVYPVIVQEQDKFYVAAQSGDTVTSPNHRRKGLFRLLHDKTMELCSKEGISFVYGFPNENSYPGFKKFGWSDSQTYTTFSKNLDIKFSLRILRKFYLTKFYKRQNNLIKGVSLPYKDFNRIDTESWLELKAGSKLYIPRSNGYMNYKYNLNSKILKFNSGMVWVSIKDNKIIIGDFFSRNQDQTLLDLHLFAKKCGFKTISFSTNIDSHADFFVRNDFEKNEERPLIINNLKKHITFKDLMITSGDFDTF